MYLRFSIALVALLSQLAGYAHVAAVKHVTCEHGEYVELHASGDTRDAFRAAVSVRHQAFDAAERADDHGHEHCVATPSRRAASLCVAPPSVGNLLDAADRAPSLAGSLVVPSRIAQYRLAPKTSPPV